MSLAWPWALFGLLALPLVVVAYRRLLRQQAERRADLAAPGPRRPDAPAPTGGGTSRRSCSSRRSP